MTETLTKSERRELLRERVVPLLLGISPRAHLLAIRLFLDCGVISFLCDERKRPLTEWNPTCRFLPWNRSEPRLAAEQLADFAESYSDCLFLVIPLRHEDQAFVAEYAPLLESRMIVANPKTLFSESPFAICHRTRKGI